ncbi:MAG TPA: hypothetical protein VKS78_17845 [Roseiarcus sp.]|nr:hypothetical protein [Roseiarcus sp.]
MRGKASSLALILALAAPAALAEPATPEGADELLAGYVAVFGQGIADKGIVTVDPDGESYKVAWHIRRALDLGDNPPPPDQFQMGDLSYEVTLGAGGVWRVTADAFPSIAFDTPTDKGRMAGKIDLTGVNVDSAYDPARPEPFTSHSTFDDVVADLKILEAGKVFPFRVEESGIQLDMKQTTTDVGANLALRETVRTFVETISVPIENQQDRKIDITFKAGAASVDGTVDQFRTQQALAAWRFLIAHKDEPKNETSVAALKALLAAGLPGWEKANVTTDASDLAFEMSLAKAHIKGLREKIELPGFTEVAKGGFGLKIDEFNLRSPLLPQGFEQLLPLSLDFDIGVKLTGLDRIAKIALEDHDFMIEKEVSPEGQAKIEQIFKDSEPTFTLEPGYLRNPLVDIAYQGEWKVSPDNFLKGRIVISADTLDKALDFAKQFADLSPDFAKAALAIGAAKGMAKTGPDGRLIWDIEMTGPPRQLTINGAPIPIGK